MTTRNVVAGLMGFLLLGTSTLAGDPKPKDSKPALEIPKCPIMGGPADLSIFTKTDDGPVYFCCPSCVKKFEADPGAYAAKVAEQRKALADRPKVQVKCPVNDMPIRKVMRKIYKGQTLYLCGKLCYPEFDKDPDKYVSRLVNTYSYQTKCPVTGNDIDPRTETTLPTGQTIYFCRYDCAEKFMADPAKYAPNLAKQLIKIDPAKIKPGG